MTKSAIISGSAKGIGAAIARQLASKGYNVVINYNTSQKQAEELASELNKISGAIAVQADISTESGAKRLFDQAVERFGKIDILVNNAAISQFKMFTDITFEEWKTMLATNIDSAFYLSKLVLPNMIHQQYGRIINIASMWGEVGASCEVHYSVSKAALIGLTKSLAKEVAPSGITVNCVSPGCIDTDMNSCHSAETLQAIAEETPVGRLGTPDDIANAVAFLASEKSSFITGQILGVNGGLII